MEGSPTPFHPSSAPHFYIVAVITKPFSNMVSA